MNALVFVQERLLLFLKTHNKSIDFKGLKAPGPLCYSIAMGDVINEIRSNYLSLSQQDQENRHVDKRHQ